MTWQRALTGVVVLLIVKVTVEVMLGYANYFPPNFDSDFLRGRDRYFFGSYQWAFYTHIATGPVALLLGIVLLSDAFRSRFPRWHRILGRWHTANVVCVVTPSGLWMARHAMTGTIAGISFALLAVLTALCTAMGCRAAMKRQFSVHRRWMWRSFVLLNSAVLLRLLGGLGTVMEVQAVWFDPVASWVSWVLPLTVLELIGISVEKNRPSRIRPMPSNTAP